MTKQEFVEVINDAMVLSDELVLQDIESEFEKQRKSE